MYGIRKGLTILIFCMVTSFVLSIPVFAINDLALQNQIQTRIDKIGTNLLNFNKIENRVVFAYDKTEKRSLLSVDKVLTDRQVIVYDGMYKSIQTDDELAAMLAREIATAVKSYSGMWGGSLDTIQVALGSKKFETVADKRAVDYMVKAGYNPLALIIFINKTCPQKRFDRISRHNLTSKRLARIYEYITYKYPEYLENNAFINDPYYQNFLLTSVENRRKLEEKIKHNYSEEIEYE